MEDLVAFGSSILVSAGYVMSPWNMRFYLTKTTKHPLALNLTETTHRLNLIFPYNRGEPPFRELGINITLAKDFENEGLDVALDLILNDHFDAHKKAKNQSTCDYVLITHASGIYGAKFISTILNPFAFNGHLNVVGVFHFL